MFYRGLVCTICLSIDSLRDFRKLLCCAICVLCCCSICFLCLCLCLCMCLRVHMCVCVCACACACADVRLFACACVIQPAFNAAAPAVSTPMAQNCLFRRPNPRRIYSANPPRYRHVCQQGLADKNQFPQRFAGRSPTARPARPFALS